MEQREENNVNPTENSLPKLDSVSFGKESKLQKTNIKFCSSHEYACVKLLEKYSKWIAIEGQTYNIQIGKCTFDFLHFGRIIEYHGTSLRCNLSTNLLKKIRPVLKRMPRKDREIILNALSDEVNSQYKKQRKRIASAHSQYANCRVICVFSPEEFVDRIISPLRTTENKSRTKLLREFESFRREYISLCKRKTKKKH